MLYPTVEPILRYEFPFSSRMSNFCDVPVFAAILYPFTAAFFAPPFPDTPSSSILLTDSATSFDITLFLAHSSCVYIAFPSTSIILSTMYGVTSSPPLATVAIALR